MTVVASIAVSVCSVPHGVRNSHTKWATLSATKLCSVISPKVSKEHIPAGMPGVNIHRTPFGGRNPEYYSEDAVFSGLMASEVIQGAAEKGVYCYLKHFAANEQETHRNGVCTWLTEQAYREVYLKPFEIAVKEGGSTAIMSSFNRVGTTWTGGDYRLLTTVLRNEWGFEGTVICDFASGQSHMDLIQMLYAGGDLWLDTLAPSNSLSSGNAADVYGVQEAM